MGTTWVIKAIPIGGLTMVLPKTSERFRFKILLISLAGPSINLLIGFLILILYPSTYETVLSFGISFSPIQSLVLSNFLIVGICLFPYSTGYRGNKVPSDGLNIIRLLFNRSLDPQEYILWYYVLQGSDCIQNGEHDKAITWYGKGMVLFPENRHILNGLAVAYINLEKYEKAKEQLKRLVLFEDGNADDKQKALNALIYNNLAYCELLMDDKGSIEDADALSLHAMASLSWHPAIKGTRGMVLVEKGELDDGIALLEESLKENETPRDKAINAASLAIAEKRRGNAERAEKYLKAALDLDENCIMIPRARTALK